MAYHLKILAFSDLHGRAFARASELVHLFEPDWIVLCGDMLPDFGMIGGKGNRLDAQRAFWEHYRTSFLREGAVTTFLLGNHELEGFSDPTLRRVPKMLEGRVAWLEGIPAEFGAWGWSREREEDELEEELLTQLDAAPKPLIYLSHVPPFGYLDRCAHGEHIGHRPLREHLEGRKWPEALVLCGHIHEAFGSREQGDTLLVNVACGYALIEWCMGTSRLLDMGPLVVSVQGE